MGDNDRLFNLQLTVQKLQEELSLYRNGTNGQELLELIGEKDKEVNILKSQVNEKNENLKKIAKKSAEVLGRCDVLQSEKVGLQAQVAEKDEQIKQLEESLEKLVSEKSAVEDLCREKENTVAEMDVELMNREENIDKLQARCAALG